MSVAEEMNHCWKDNHIIGYSTLQGIPNYKQSMLECVNKSNGLMILRTSNNLIILGPINSNEYEQILSMDSSNIDERVRFIDDNIYICDQKEIRHYKIVHTNQQYSIKHINNYSLSALAAFDNVLFTDNSLLIFTGITLDIYKLYPEFSLCRQVDFIQKGSVENAYLHQTDDDNITIYINHNQQLSAFNLSQPEETKVDIVNTSSFGVNNKFCASCKYGVFWISCDGQQLYQSAQHKPYANIRLLNITSDKIAWNMISSNSEYSMSDIDEFLHVEYDEDFGISGRLLLFCRVQSIEHDDDEYKSDCDQCIVLQMYNHNEVSFLYDLCHPQYIEQNDKYSQYLSIIYSFIYADLVPIAKQLIPDRPSKDAIVG